MNLPKAVTLLANKSLLNSNAKHSAMASNRIAYCALALFTLFPRPASPQPRKAQSKPAEQSVNIERVLTRMLLLITAVNRLSLLLILSKDVFHNEHMGLSIAEPWSANRLLTMPSTALTIKYRKQYCTKDYQAMFHPPWGAPHARPQQEN
jgi:hypothetical protein